MPSRVWKEQNSNLHGLLFTISPSFRLLAHYIFTDRARRLIKVIIVVTISFIISDIITKIHIFISPYFF